MKISSQKDGFLRPVLAGASMLAMISAAQAAAQDTSGNAGGDPAKAGAAAAAQPSLAEIIVTANRTAQNLQRAPVAVTVVSAEDIISKGVSRPEDLNSVAPALQIQPTQGAFSNYVIRGISSQAGSATTDPSISINYDGVPLGRASEGRGIYYDLERVEVLPGPQGTLYGRNASAGVINVIPQKAKLGVFEGNFMLEGGNYGRVASTGAINVPIGETLAARVAFQTANHNGYFKDGSDDQDDKAARLKVLWRPSSTFSLDLGADYSKDGGIGQLTPYFVANGTALTPITGDPWAGPHGPGVDAAVAAYRPDRLANSFQHNHDWGVNATANLVTPIGDLYVIPAYRHSTLDYNTEFQGAGIRYLGDDQQGTVEARLQSNKNRKLQYLAGFFYFNETVNDTPVFDNHAYSSEVVSSQHSIVGTQAYSGFGRLTWSATDTVHLTGGIRYTHEDRSLNADQTTTVLLPYLTFPIVIPNNGIVNSASYSKVTYRAATDWQVTSRNMVYASIETGFKAGGFYNNASVPQRSSTYLPETVTAFTLGSKNRFLDNRLQVNLEAFYYLYNNQQFLSQTYDPVGPTAAPQLVYYTQNMGQQKIKGLQVDLLFKATSTTQISTNLQYLSGKVGSFSYTFVSPVNGSLCKNGGPDPAYTQRYLVDCTGSPLLQSPTLSGTFGITQSVPLSNGGRFVFDGSGNFRTSVWTSQQYLNPQHVGGYIMLDASLGYHMPGDKLVAELWVRNATDRYVLTNPGPDINAANTGGTTALWGSTVLPPRTFGIRLSAKFGR